MKVKLLFLCFILLSKISIAQNHHIYGLFPTYIADLKLNSKWSTSMYSFLSINPLHQESKSIEYPAQTNAFYIEIDATYSITEEWSLSGSYTYERANPFNNNYRNENRLTSKIDVDMIFD